MPALNFQSQFAAALENGTKCQMIRAPRKHPIKVGDVLHLFTGMRQRGCRKLLEATCSGQLIEWQANTQADTGPHQ